MSLDKSSLIKTVDFMRDWQEVEQQLNDVVLGGKMIQSGWCLGARSAPPST